MPSVLPLNHDSCAANLVMLALSSARIARDRPLPDSEAQRTLEQICVLTAQVADGQTERFHDNAGMLYAAAYLAAHIDMCEIGTEMVAGVLDAVEKKVKERMTT